MLACVQVLWLSLADLKLCLGDSGLEGLETFSGTVTELEDDDCRSRGAADDPGLAS